MTDDSCIPCRIVRTWQNHDDRLRVLAPMVCEGCGCALGLARTERARLVCVDCCWYGYELSLNPSARAACCISVGLRALCGRRILEGC